MPLVLSATACGGSGEESNDTSSGQRITDQGYWGKGDVDFTGRIQDSSFTEALETVMRSDGDQRYCPSSIIDSDISSFTTQDEDHRADISADVESISADGDHWTVDFTRRAKGVIVEDVSGTKSFDADRVDEMKSRADVTVESNGFLCVMDIREVYDGPSPEEYRRQSEQQAEDQKDTLYGKEEGFLGRPRGENDPMVVEERWAQDLPDVMSLERALDEGPVDITERGLDESDKQCDTSERVIWVKSSRGMDNYSSGVVCAGQGGDRYYFRGTFDVSSDINLRGKVVSGTLSKGEFEIEPESGGTLSITGSEWEYIQPNGKTRTMGQASAGIVISEE